MKQTSLVLTFGDLDFGHFPGGLDVCIKLLQLSRRMLDKLASDLFWLEMVDSISL